MKTKHKLLAIGAIIVIMLAVQIYKDISGELKQKKMTWADWYWGLSYTETDALPLVDNGAVYGDDTQDVQVTPLYVTVLPTEDSAGGWTTLAELNAIHDFKAERPELQARFSTGPTEAEGANAVITLRGHSTMESPYKSYKIKLNPEEQPWQGQTVIHLNKHPFDSFKVRNKIAFDLIEQVPYMTSMKTWLVQLYVRDLSAGQHGEYQDYGLFTAIEHANEQFLANHGLDKNGHLYKAEMFEFFRSPEDLFDTKSPFYDQSHFEYYLEIKEGNTHTKFLKMLDDVNNEKLNADRVLNKHFNRDNYFAWLAVNILLGNYDTTSQNFFLYSPHDTLTWYFLPWDYDDCMEETSQYFNPSGEFIWTVGVANYWNSVLHNRVFRNPANVEALNNKIEEVYKILSPEAIQREVDKYRPVVEEYILKGPDRDLYAGFPPLAESTKEIVNCTTVNRNRYYATLEKPMPVYLSDPEPTGEGDLIFYWGESYDLQGDRISYTFQVAQDIFFNEIVIEEKHLTETELRVYLDPGQYYWRVLIQDHKGNTQFPFDQIYTKDWIYHGLKEFALD